jgi:hypothetical protein
MKYIIIDGVVLSRPLEGPLAAHIESFAKVGQRAGLQLVHASSAGIVGSAVQPMAWTKARQIAQHFFTAHRTVFAISRSTRAD